MIKRFLLLGLIISFIVLVIGCAPIPQVSISPIPKADLIVLSIDSIGTYAEYSLWYQVYMWEIEVGFTIANIGTADAGPFNAQIMAGDVPDPNPVIAIAPPNIIQDISDNDPDPYIAIGGASYSGLAAGDTSYQKTIVKITASDGFATSDPHNPDLGVLITVDSDNEVIESNEGNNYLWKLSYPKADLMVISFDSISVSYGVVNTTIIFTIANYGIADAGPFKVLVSADPELSQQETVNVVSLAKSSSTTLTVTLPGSSCFDPDCNVCITVDSDNEVIESNEENNDFCELTIG
jgi:hypothetical protein